mgnify:CR=1 FL=1
MQEEGQTEEGLNPEVPVLSMRETHLQSYCLDKKTILTKGYYFSIARRAPEQFSIGLTLGDLAAVST